MRAAYITYTGEPECIHVGELSNPVPGPSQVLVQVAAAAVNPIDTYIRSGMIALPLPVPYVVGCDLAGTVLEVGADVTRFQPGDRVWGSNQGLAGRQGTFAELAAVDEQWLYPIPENVTEEQAAAGALVAITAGLGLRLHGKLQPGELLFVNGGSGGVGSVVVQLAKRMGARVITTAGSAEKLEYCRSLGADLVLDYRADDCDQQLQAYVEQTGKINFWWETLRTPDLARTIPLMAKRGRIVLMAGREAQPEFPLGAFYTNDLSLIGFAMFNASAAEQQHVAEEINAALSAGELNPLIGIRLPLGQAAQAHRLQEEKTLHRSSPLSGKIVITINS